MKLIAKIVKDLDKFIEYLGAKGYIVEEGPHAVLLDHSEVLEIYARVRGVLEAVFVAHYLTPYYLAESEEYGSDEEYLRRLLEIKHSGTRWRIPVNPVIGVILNEKIIDVVKEYSDEYPVENGGSIVEEYRSRNPEYARIPRVVVAHLIDKLTELR